MTTRYRTTALSAVLLVLASLACTSALAADTPSKAAVEAPRNVASVWVLWPHRGHGADLEAAMKQFVAWRREQGEPTRWQVWVPVVGTDLNHYVVRSGDHAWSDHDTLSEWSRTHKAGAKYASDLAPHVRDEQHFYSVSDTKRSHWQPMKPGEMRYVAVTSYRFKGGTRPVVNEVLEKVHEAVTAAQWPYAYGIDYTMGGKGSMTVVVPMRNMADMADPDPELMEVLADSMGSKAAAEDLMARFGAAIEDREFAVYMHRPDLSSPE
jgi:hypothetical protein